jgi:hypothetical protein
MYPSKARMRLADRTARPGREIVETGLCVFQETRHRSNLRFDIRFRCPGAQGRLNAGESLTDAVSIAEIGLLRKRF